MIFDFRLKLHHKTKDGKTHIGRRRELVIVSELASRTIARAKAHGARASRVGIFALPCLLAALREELAVIPVVSSSVTEFAGINETHLAAFTRWMLIVAHAGIELA